MKEETERLTKYFECKLKELEGTKKMADDYAESIEKGIYDVQLMLLEIKKIEEK